VICRFADLAPDVAGQQIGGADEARAGRGRDRLERLRLAAAADDDRRSRVADDMFELRRGVRRRQRHGHASGAPDRPRDHHVREARWNQVGDARFLQVAARTREDRRDSRGRFIEVEVGEHAVGGDDGETVGSDGPFSHSSSRTSSTGSSLR